MTIVATVLSLVTLIRPVADAQLESTDVCDEHNSCRAPGRSLLQVTKSAREKCELPEGGVWNEVRLDGVPPFEMAMRKGGVIAKEIEDKGYYEFKDTSHWGPPGNALDIGGNIGYYTFALAQTGWHVTTFEPMDHNIAFMKATMCKNPELAKRVDLVETGLGSRSVECAVIEMFDNVGDGMVRCEGDNNGGGSPWNPWNFEGSTTRGTFKIRRLDEVLKERKIKNIDFIKLDVEGYECEALKGAGAESFLREFHPRLVKSEVWQTQERCIHGII